MSDTQELLYRIGAFPLDVTLGDAKELAEAIWYQGYCPTKAEFDLVRLNLPREGFRRLLCVMELLSQYPVCQRDTARHLQHLTKHFHHLLLGGGHVLVQGRYSPSKRWGITDSTVALRKALLPMQTRSYADSVGAHNGFGAPATRMNQ